MATRTEKDQAIAELVEDIKSTNVIYLADTSGMTAEDVDRITALIRRMAQNRTVLMVEHNLSVVSTLSHHITVLARGQILAEGEYEKVSRDPRVVEAYMGTGHG